VRLTGFVYRTHNPKWAFAADPVQGAGGFNLPGTPALYTSLRFETAWLEAQQAFPFKAQPMTLCAYDVDCEDILDLTDAATLVAFGTAAVIVPSFATGGASTDRNVVFWDWAAEPPHRVRVIDGEHRLPRDASSWR